MGFLDFMKDYGQNLFSGKYRDRLSSAQLGDPNYVPPSGSGQLGSGQLGVGTGGSGQLGGGTGQSSTKPVVEDLLYKTTSTGEQLPESTTIHNPNRREVKDDWDLRAIQAEEAWNNREDDPEKAKKFNLMMANRLAKTFDPQSKEGVQAIQTYMQRAGIKDYEGKEIEADAMFGRRTESGLRQIQDMYERQNMGMSDYGFKNTPPPSQFSQGSSPPTDPSFSLSMPEASQGQPDDIFDVVDLRK